MTSRWTIGLLVMVWGCGGGTPPPDAPEGDDATSAPEPVAASDGGSDGPAPDAPAPDEEEENLPDRCAAKDDKACYPSPKFVKKLCGGDFPTVAVALFQHGTPWTRAYLAHETEAWNASGGGSSPEKLMPDEEVLILRHRGDKKPGGIQVSGANGSYDVLRWDGLCVTLDPSELLFGDPPPRIENARVIWARLELDTRDALKENEKVYDAYLSMRKTCKGATMGAVSKECEKFDGELSELIAKHVREKGGIPTPNKLP